MPYDEGLEAELEQITRDWPGVERMKMFGGLGYLLNGNMTIGIWRDYLIARVGPAETKLRKIPGVSDMDITGRPMKGWIKAELKTWSTPRHLDAITTASLNFVRTLPPK